MEVAQVEATDPDTIGKLRYTISDKGNTGGVLFRVNEVTGRIYVSDGAADSEGRLIKSRRRYNFGVKVTDGKYQDTAEVTIYLKSIKSTYFNVLLCTLLCTRS